MFVSHLLVFFLSYPLATESFNWFGYGKKKPSVGNVDSVTTRDKLKQMLSYYNTSTTTKEDVRDSLSSRIPEDLSNQAASWTAKQNSNIRNDNINLIRSEIPPLRNSGIRKYSSRRPMDGAAFHMTDSGETTSYSSPKCNAHLF